MAVVDLHSSSDSSFEDRPTKESNSWPQSPSLSQYSSTESETSDQGAAADDDYIAELTRQMAHYMLQDFDDPSYNTPPIQEEADQENSTVVPENEIHPVSEFQKKQALIDEQIRSVQLNRLKQERERKQNKKGRGNRGKNRALVNGMPPPVNENNDNSNKKGQKQKAWWSQQQGIRSGGGCPEVMRAVFLGDSGKAPTTGTGVFLPRVVGDSTTTTASADSRKKPGYSTVLIPARVVQALKLHFDKIGTVASTMNPPPAAAAVTMPLQHGIKY
ncbi:hypothetical protein LINGRAHAP2_LOCUS5945 [Linum grandiflorum]